MRRELRAEITASLLFGLGAAVVMALVTYALFSGDPFTRFKLAFWASRSREVSPFSTEGVRTSAVTMWPLCRASRTTWVPVRPVAPRIRICISVCIPKRGSVVGVRVALMKGRFDLGMKGVC